MAVDQGRVMANVEKSVFGKLYIYIYINSHDRGWLKTKIHINSTSASQKGMDYLPVVRFYTSRHSEMLDPMPQKANQK